MGDQPSGLGPIDTGAPGGARSRGRASLTRRPLRPSARVSHGAQSSRSIGARWTPADVARRALSSRAVESGRRAAPRLRAPAAWLPRACAALDEVLLDHATAKKKAAARRDQLLFSYPHPASCKSRSRRSPARSSITSSRCSSSSTTGIAMRPEAEPLTAWRCTPWSAGTSPIACSTCSSSALDRGAQLRALQILAEARPTRSSPSSTGACSRARRAITACTTSSQGCSCPVAVRDARLADLADAEAEIIARPCEWVRLHAG